jgi:transcription elongation GreA/GreB family factor
LGLGVVGSGTTCKSQDIAGNRMMLAKLVGIDSIDISNNKLRGKAPMRRSGKESKVEALVP